MLTTIRAGNVPRAYEEIMTHVAMGRTMVPEQSRNGPVLSFPGPLVLTIGRPDQRVLFDPTRDANPFFHAMEFVWMMSGSNDVKWIEFFNSRMREFADGDRLHGAYGHRWRSHFNLDQIAVVIAMLRKNPKDRRALLAMWDPDADLGGVANDLPCNTHIYPRVNSDGKLDFLVCNRSNDLVWGMLGANAVHMTMLQELFALAIGVPLGQYRVISNNAHFYTEMPRAAELRQFPARHDYYARDKLQTYPLLQEGENVVDFIDDCTELLSLGVDERPWRTKWMEHVGQWIYKSYHAYKANDLEDARTLISSCVAEDWRVAGLEWLARRNVKRIVNERERDVPDQARERRPEISHPQTPGPRDGRTP